MDELVVSVLQFLLQCDTSMHADLLKQPARGKKCGTSYSFPPLLFFSCALHTIVAPTTFCFKIKPLTFIRNIEFVLTLAK